MYNIIPNKKTFHKKIYKIYMAKIENDKYYTPVELSKYCIEKTFELIGEENISDIIEPSAGSH